MWPTEKCSVIVLNFSHKVHCPCHVDMNATVIHDARLILTTLVGAEKECSLSPNTDPCLVNCGLSEARNRNEKR